MSFAQLPLGWSDADIGAPGLAGSTAFSNGQWTVAGGGSDICHYDQMHFTWTALTGDGAVVARVADLHGAPYGLAGVMFRDSTDVGALHAAVLTTTNSGITFQWRNTFGATCSYEQALGAPATGVPLWLKLARDGNDFYGYWSTNNADWNLLGPPQTVAMNQTVLAGLSVSANDNSLLCTATFTDATVPRSAFGIHRERWTNLNPALGNTLAALTNTANNPNWPANPGSQDQLLTFETETNSGATYYGQRLRAFVIPPAYGAFTFSIASDNTSQLFLSSDETPGHAAAIASVSGATNPREWTREANQQSAPVFLQAGHRYYLEAIMQQSTGNDNLAVRWQLPDGVYEEPMLAASAAGTHLVPYSGADTLPGIYSQPASITVGDNLPATFSILVTNQSPVTYQWLASGTNLPGANATSPVYAISNANPLLNNNQLFACVVSNSAGAVTSSPALLTVLLDATAPTVTRSVYLNASNAQVIFSESIQPLTATNRANYVFTNGVTILSAALAANQRTVTLTTAPLTVGSNYVLIINNIRDLASAPNVIATNTTVALFAGDYSLEPIGNSTPAGNIAGFAGDYDLSGGGSDIGGVADQFQFASRAITGDFDFKVRLKSLSQTDPFAKAGLMARATLDANSPFAAALATPTISGAFFESRSAAGFNAITSGNVPVNYPDTWLRLQRAGDVFTGFASYDGLTWQQLDSTTLRLTDPIYFGLAACSHDTNQTALAQFRQLSFVTNAASGTLALPREPLGPSSRRTGLALTEIMYHPASRADGRNLEFIELFNPQPFFEDISGYSISGDVSFTFPPGTVLESGAYLVVAASPADIQAVYGIGNVNGPYTNSLSNSSGTVRLRNKQDAILLETKYDSVPPWPAAADGAGHSLVLNRPSYGEGSPLAWTLSDVKGGSPGGTDGFGPEPAHGVVINEFLAHTDPPLFDTIELFNRGTNSVDLSGCFLSDDPKTNKFQIPGGTQIAGRGFVVFDERQLGFRIDAAGETLYLVNAANTRVLDAVRFEGQANGVSSGRSRDGAPAIRALATLTFGTNNSPPLAASVVINELMYASISGNDDDQYVELYNNLATTVDLNGWRFTSGISYTFPSNCFLAPHAYLVVARNVSRMLANYPNLNSTNLVGNFDGSLAGRGERVALSMPDLIVSTNSAGQPVTNTIYIVANEVTYGTGGRWGQWANGGGSSLELIDPHADNSLAPNWGDSDETAKAPWTNIEYTGLLDLGNASYAPDQLQLFLQDAGECLIDNVEVFKVGETNRIPNPNFDSGVTGWFFQGTHHLSGVDATGGYASAPCLHVRASARGDTGANRIRAALSATLTTGTSATLRAKARWLKGNPELLLRLHGNWLEAAGRLAVPANLGTPGARNSRYLTNAGPAITEVTHAPILPAGGQPVVVTARVSDPDGVASVLLRYRNDSLNSTTLSVTMRDDGAAGDQLAGDGIFSATIPAQSTGTLLAFYVQATDAASSPATSRFPADAPGHECLIRFGEPPASSLFGTYHTWVVGTNVSYWSLREKNSNDPIDATFVDGNFRVVYNAQTLYSGSPFHTSGYTGPAGSPCDYVLICPDDDRVLGANDFVIATVGNLGSDDTAQREQTAFWMLRELGEPSLHRRFVFMYVNGARRGTIVEDAQQPSSEQVSEYFPNDDQGHLHKIEDWFEFDNSASSFVNVDATLDNFVSGGVKKTARYRWNWRPRAVQSSANDFTNLFNLVDALHASTPEPYTREVQSLTDVEEWMRVLALERFVDNWDSFSYQRGKNMYAYKPEHGPWQLLAWDIDFVFDLGGVPTVSLFGGEDSSVNAMRAFPPFARAYWRAFQDILDGPAQDSRLTPLLDAKYNALVAAGVPVASPALLKSWVPQRRSYVQSQLDSVAAPFAIRSVIVTNNVAVITGTAPVKARSILFNGAAYPITWTSVTGWIATLPLHAGVNPFTVLGLDYTGQIVPGTSNYIAPVFNGTVPSPAGQIVLNEVMYDPLVPNAEFVELFNTSSNTTFDLSGCEFQGLAYTFPAGALLGPTNYLVLASDRYTYASAYKTPLPVFDTFDGKLQGNGETLTLSQPGTNGDQVIAKVRYDDGAPWPAAAKNTGSSLQLIDPRQDNWRAGNWRAVQTGPQWVYFATNGTSSSSTLYLYLQSAGDLYLDDLKLVPGIIPEAGTNVLVDGDFETGFPGAWTVSANLANSVLSTAAKHSGSAALHLVSTSAGSSQASSIWQTVSPTLPSSQPYTLSFWYLQNTNGGPLVVRLSGSGVSASINPAPALSALAAATPNGSNSVSATLPAFPPLWLNELEADNLTGITNRAGQPAPWLELYNPGSNTVSLSGLYLANNYNYPTLWALPATASIAPGQFKLIFADGQTNLTTTTELHTSFVLTSRAGTVCLSRLYLGLPQVLDYVTYTNLGLNRSYGSFPDGQSFARQEFFYPSPGTANNGSSPVLSVVVNEWMADNTVTLADPADNDYEDWFELYNWGTNTVDLGGYYLTDTLTNRFQYQIPDTGQYTIPPHGYLLVWADNETKQNSPARADLHVNFKLDKAGEAIGLFGTDGSPIDYVTFGPQLTDLSMGRYPDGSPNIFFLPTPTPRASNPAPNTPPHLAALPDQVLTVGQTLNLVASATDTDLPPQTLTFSLAPGAPPGAGIDPVNGRLSWTPTLPGTWPISVVVSDNGSPSLSDTQTFVVTAFLPPQLTQLAVLNHQFSFAWGTVAGQSYQLEYKDSVAAPAWNPLGPPMAGSGLPISVTNDLTLSAQRYYRVLLLP